MLSNELNYKVYKLTITVIDPIGDEIEDMCPLSSAVSNLQYDGYTVLSQDKTEITWEEASNDCVF